ncbi:hypothetical protein BJV82DRAFT_229247 [Fennellomyces sp. T-0311]|nr:hypothetical protein BJV82DRAFT_229247 [Fennellomyces sp. T-0311]
MIDVFSKSCILIPTIRYTYVKCVPKQKVNLESSFLRAGTDHHLVERDTRGTRKKRQLSKGLRNTSEPTLSYSIYFLYPAFYDVRPDALVLTLWAHRRSAVHKQTYLQLVTTGIDGLTLVTSPSETQRKRIELHGPNDQSNLTSTLGPLSFRRRQNHKLPDNAPFKSGGPTQCTKCPPASTSDRDWKSKFELLIWKQRYGKPLNMQPEV